MASDVSFLGDGLGDGLGVILVLSVIALGFGIGSWLWKNI